LNNAGHRAEILIRRWVRFYTVGLDAGLRHDRRAEIDSDLWEHRNHASAEGEGSAATSFSILGRWAAGIPADLSWWASQVGRSGTTNKERFMSNTVGKYWWQGLAALTALVSVYQGIRQFFTDEVAVGISAGKIVGLVLFVTVGVLTMLGLAIHRTRPRRGAAMVIIGVLPVALVGGLGIGIVIGLVASLFGGEGWWWVPVGIASALATAAAIGAFSAWWHAAPARAATSPRTISLPMALVLVGLVAAGAGVGVGLLPVAGLGAVIAIVGIAIVSRRIKTSS
jgi:MFS family permease